MSKFTEFVGAWNGKYLTVLNPGRQCFDVPAKWCDILGVPDFPGNPTPFPYVNAHQIYTSFGEFQAKHFERIANGPSNSPQEGDIVVWAASYNGGIGHVAVATGKGDANTFQAFSQNDPTGSVCIVRNYNYNHVLGWLRPKNYNVTPSPVPSNPSLQRKASWYDRWVIAREGDQDTNKRTDAQDKEFGERSLREMKRAVTTDEVVKALFPGQDSNKITSKQILEKLGGFTQKDLDEAFKKGRIKGIEEVDIAVHKLLG